MSGFFFTPIGRDSASLLSQPDYEVISDSGPRRVFYDEAIRYSIETRVYLDLCRNAEPATPQHTAPSASELAVLAYGMDSLCPSDDTLCQCKMPWALTQITRFLPGRAPVDTARIWRNIHTSFARTDYSRSNLPEVHRTFRRDYPGFKFAVSRSLFAFIKSAVVVCIVDLANGKSNSVRIDHPLDLRVVNSTTVYVLTKRGKIFSVALGFDSAALVFQSRRVDKFKVNRSVDPLFVASWKSSLFYGSEFHQSRFTFPSQIVDFEILGDRVFVAADSVVSILKGDETIDQFTSDIRIKGLCLGSSPDSAFVWGGKTLESIDFRSSDVSRVLDFDIRQCLVASHFVAVAGRKALIVIDDRFPTETHSEILKAGEPFKAAWIDGEDVLAVADARGLKLFDIGQGSALLNRYPHTSGTVTDIQTTDDSVFVTTNAELVVLQMNTRPILLDAVL
jgi:hypothetical protein